MKDDWKFHLMADVTELVQVLDVPMVPVAATFDMESTTLLVPPLSGLIGAEKEKLPGFFLVHALTDQVVHYPDALDEAKNFTPELIVNWALRVNDEILVSHLEQQLDAAKAEGSEVTEEQIKAIEEHLEQGKESLKANSVREQQVKETIKESNEWADSLHLHKDVAEAHGYRLE